eukprot:1143294-Pelagomonas_calceolata.AAC.1
MVASDASMILPSWQKQNYAGTGNFPYINKGKGDTLAQKSRASPPTKSRNNIGKWESGGLLEAPSSRTWVI